MTRFLRLRDFYTADELLFVADAPAWAGMIDAYYEMQAGLIPIDSPTGPVDGLQEADVTPPATFVTATAVSEINQVITLTWTATDTQNSVVSATLWHRQPVGNWFPVATQLGASGEFVAGFVCGPNLFVVRAQDSVGNVTPIAAGTSGAATAVDCFSYLPTLLKP